MLVTATSLQDALRPQPLRILKAETGPKRYTLGLAYAPHRLDAHGEGMTADEVEQTAWGYLRKQEIGLFHQDGTVGHARPVESYIWRGEPWHITDVTGNEQVIMPGDWMLGAVWDPGAWALVKSGKINGWSMDGFGRRRKIQRTAFENVTKSTTPPARLTFEAALTRALRKESPR